MIAYRFLAFLYGNLGFCFLFLNFCIEVCIDFTLGIGYVGERTVALLAI